MAHTYIHRAQPIGDETVKIRVIHIQETIPDCEDIPEADTLLSLDANKLHEALYQSLPGGTYDRLLGLMLQKKASHFIVPHFEAR